MHGAMLITFKGCSRCAADLRVRLDPSFNMAGLEMRFPINLTWTRILLPTILVTAGFLADTYQNQAQALEQLRVGSTAFQNGSTVPKQFTADGTNSSPPIWW